MLLLSLQRLLVRLQRRRVSRFHATLTSVRSFGQAKRHRRLCQTLCSMLTFVSVTKKTLKKFSASSRVTQTLQAVTSNLQDTRAFLNRWLQSSTLNMLCLHSVFQTLLQIMAGQPASITEIQRNSIIPENTEFIRLLTA